MGFLDFLKKEKKPVEEEVVVAEKKINIDDLLHEVKEKIGSDAEKASISIKKSSERINNELMKIKESAKNMENKYFEKSDKTYTRINMIKDTWLKKLIGSLNNLPSLKGDEFEPVKKYLENINQVLANATSTDTKQNYILSNYFKDDMKKMVSGMSKINEEMELIKSEISEGKPVRIIGDIKSLTGELNGLKEKAFELSQDIAKKKKQIDELVSMEAERKKNLEALEGGSDMQRLKNIESNIKKIEDETSSIRLRISEDLNTVNRPLKKIKHKMDPGTARLLSEFLSSPVDMCLSDGGEEKIENIIRIISKYADDKDVGLQEKDAKKIAAFAEKIKGGEIKKMKNDYMEKMARLESMKEELKLLEKIKSRATSIKNDIDMVSGERARINEELDRVTGELEETKKKIEETKEKISDYTGKNLKAKYIIND